MIAYIYCTLNKDDELLNIFFESTDENAIEHYKNHLIPLYSQESWLYLCASYDDVFTQFKTMLKVMLTNSICIKGVRYA